MKAAERAVPMIVPPRCRMPPRSFQAFPDGVDVDAAPERGARHRPHRRVHARRIAAAGQDADRARLRAVHRCVISSGVGC
jgi:hypothetical protein